MSQEVPVRIHQSGQQMTLQPVNMQVPKVLEDWHYVYLQDLFGSQTPVIVLLLALARSRRSLDRLVSLIEPEIYQSIHLPILKQMWTSCFPSEHMIPTDGLLPSDPVLYIMFQLALHPNIELETLKRKVGQAHPDADTNATMETLYDFGAGYRRTQILVALVLSRSGTQYGNLAHSLKDICPNTPDHQNAMRFWRFIYSMGGGGMKEGLVQWPATGHERHVSHAVARDLVHLCNPEAEVYWYAQIAPPH